MPESDKEENFSIIIFFFVVLSGPCMRKRSLSLSLYLYHSLSLSTTYYYYDDVLNTTPSIACHGRSTEGGCVQRRFRVAAGPHLPVPLIARLVDRSSRGFNSSQ